MAETANGFTRDLARFTGDVTEGLSRYRGACINALYYMDNAVVSWQNNPIFMNVFPPYGRMYRLMNVFRLGLGVTRAFARGQKRLLELATDKLNQYADSDEIMDGRINETMKYREHKESARQQSSNYAALNKHLLDMLNIINDVDTSQLSPEQIDALNDMRNSMTNMSHDISEMQDFESEVESTMERAEQSAIIQDEQAMAEDGTLDRSVGLDDEPLLIDVPEDEIYVYNEDVMARELEASEANENEQSDDLEFEDDVDYEMEPEVVEDSSAAIDAESFADAENDLSTDGFGGIASEGVQEQMFDEGAVLEEPEDADNPDVDEETEDLTFDDDYDDIDLESIDNPDINESEGEETAEELIVDEPGEDVSMEESAEDLIVDEPVSNGDEYEDTAEDLVSEDDSDGSSDAEMEEIPDAADAAEEVTSDGSSDSVSAVPEDFDELDFDDDELLVEDNSEVISEREDSIQREELSEQEGISDGNSISATNEIDGGVEKVVDSTNMKDMGSSMSSLGQLGDSADIAVSSIGDDAKIMPQLSGMDAEFEKQYGVQSANVASIRDWENSDVVKTSEHDSEFHESLSRDINKFKNSSTMNMMSRGSIPGVTYDDYSSLNSLCKKAYGSSYKLGKEISRQNVLYSNTNERYTNAITSGNVRTAGHLNDVMRLDLKAVSHNNMKDVYGDIHSSTDLLSKEFDAVVDKVKAGYKQQGRKIPMSISDEFHNLSKMLRADARLSKQLGDAHGYAGQKYETFESSLKIIDGNYQRAYSNYLSHPTEMKQDSAVSSYETNLKNMQQVARDKGMSHEAAEVADYGMDR